MPSGILFPGGHPAADVALLLVFIQHGSGRPIQCGVQPPEPKGNVLVYGGFGDAEMPRGGADGGTRFNDVHSQFTGSLFNLLCHILTSDAVCCPSLFRDGEDYECAAGARGSLCTKR